MSGFKVRISGVGSDHSTKYAAATAAQVYPKHKVKVKEIAFINFLISITVILDHLGSQNGD